MPETLRISRWARSKRSQRVVRAEARQRVEGSVCAARPRRARKSLFRAGAVRTLFLRPDGTVKSSQKISDTFGQFSGDLGGWDYFGWSVARLPDLDGDGVAELAVGAAADDDGGNGRGAVWILFLNGTSEPANCCLGDTNGDCVVDALDLRSAAVSASATSWKKAGSLHVTKWSQKDLRRIQTYRNGLTK